MPDDSYIQVNEGADRSVSFVQRSKASNTVEETVVVSSLPYIPTYVVSTTTAVALATANSHVLQVLGSTLNRTLLRSLEVTQLANAVASTRVAFQLLRVTDAGTGGTAITANQNDPVDPETTAAGMTLPSSKGTEDELLGTWTGTVLAAAAAAGHDYVLKVVFPEDGHSKPPTIAAGATTGLVLKNITAEPSATLHVRATFEEVFWA